MGDASSALAPIMSPTMRIRIDCLRRRCAPDRCSPNSTSNRISGGILAEVGSLEEGRRPAPADGTRVYTEEAVPLKLTLPTDLDRRLHGLGDAIGAASDDVVFAYLFGSAATGALTPRSDVDVAIFAAPGVDTHAVRLAVARACARHLGTDAIDVVMLNTAPISLAGRVLMTRRVLLDRDPHARHRYESLHARMFQDFRIREHRLLTERDASG